MTSQLDLFTATGRTARLPAAQAEHLTRVGDRIGSHILAFLRDVGAGGEFRMAELVAYVAARDSAAPGSAGRILRSLNRKGVVAYVLVSRRESLYRVVMA